MYPTTVMKYTYGDVGVAKSTDESSNHTNNNRTPWSNDEISACTHSHSTCQRRILNMYLRGEKKNLKVDILMSGYIRPEYFFCKFPTFFRTLEFVK